MKSNNCEICGGNYAWIYHLDPEEVKEMAEYNYHNYIYLTCNDECYHKKLDMLGIEMTPRRVKREDFEKRLHYMRTNNKFEE